MNTKLELYFCKNNNPLPIPLCAIIATDPDLFDLEKDYYHKNHDEYLKLFNHTIRKCNCSNPECTLQFIRFNGKI